MYFNKVRFVHKSTLIILGGVFFVAVSIYSLLLSPTTQSTNLEFNNLKIGMSREHVIQAVGAPPGDYTNGTYSGCAKAFGGSGWVTSKNELIVNFDDNDIATQIRIVPVVIVYKPSTYDRICDFLAIH